MPSGGILITGGTGSFGKTFVRALLRSRRFPRIVIYSRDEYKQFVMRQALRAHDHRMRYFIGDVRDRERLLRALDGVECVVHAAALKQVPACEYNPFEAIKTNVLGAQNVIDAAVERRVRTVVALSTDKAVNPINLYGATKLASDKLFVAANAYGARSGTTFSVVRYGNVAGSRGSVIPFFKSLIDGGARELPITDQRMTRFWITLDEAVQLVFKALSESRGGETYVSKIPSFKVVDLARAMLPGARLKDVGIREGEKLHEVMITEYDSFNTYEYPHHYIIYPHFDWWKKARNPAPGGRRVPEFFSYRSDNNTHWLSAGDLRKRLREIDIVY